MKKFLLLGLLALVMFPGFVTAQSDIDPSGGVVSSCINLSNNMRYRMRDISVNGEVSTLQDFLQTRGYLNSEPTGFFGILTLKAVKDFQSANGISPTGYVGPITRAKIRELSCQGVVIPQPAPPTLNECSGLSKEKCLNTVSCKGVYGPSVCSPQLPGGALICTADYTFIGCASAITTPQPVPIPPQPTPAPTVISLQPASGSVGTKVTITGSRFTPTNNSVKFGGGYLNGISSNGTQITFTVPDGLSPCPPGGTVCIMSYMQVTPGLYPVFVINSNGTSNAVNFTVTTTPINERAPYITSATNVATPTDIVTVTGGRFHSTSNTVNVNGVLRVLPSSNNGTVINFSIADFGLSALILYRFDVHTSEGGSNVWTFQVGPTVPSIFSYGISTVGTLSVLQGASVATSVNLYLVSGTPQPVALAVSGLPYGVTGSFSSPSCTPTCSSTLTLTAGASVTPGTYTLTVFAVGGGITRTSTFGLVVSAPAPTLTVLSPNGGEKWEVGKTYSITWKSNGLDQVNINLLSADPVNEGSYRISRLVSNLSASMGNYSWVVPEKTECLSLPCITLPEHRNHKIEIVDARYAPYNSVSKVYSDTSDAPFNIVAVTSTIPTLTVALDSSTPASQTVTAGQSNVTFAKVKLAAGSQAVNNMNAIQVGSDSANASAVLANIKVYDGAVQLGTTVSSLVYNGSYYYQWIYVSGVSIPANTSKILTIVADIKSTASSGTVRLGIAGWNFDLPGTQVSPFSTAIYGNVMTIGSVTTPSITVLSPNGGEMWTIGKTYDITWQFSGTVGKVVQIGLGLPASDGPFIAANISASSGKYSWTIPSTIAPRNDYRVIIREPSPSYLFLDNSNTPFSIVTTPPTYQTDMQIFRLCFGKVATSSPECTKADFDNSGGLINFTDLALLRGAPRYDLNGDGMLNYTDTPNSDFNIFSACFGKSTISFPDCTKTDFDANGIVNFTDLALFRNATKYDLNGDGKIDLQESVTVFSSRSQTANVLGAFGNSSASIPPNILARTVNNTTFSHQWNKDLGVGSIDLVDVSALQTALSIEGVYADEITGGFYNKTQTAVKLFQQKYNINPTGFVGPQTRSKLNALYY